jgi:hypothetical protein
VASIPRSLFVIQIFFIYALPHAGLGESAPVQATLNLPAHHALFAIGAPRLDFIAENFNFIGAERASYIFGDRLFYVF